MSKERKFFFDSEFIEDGKTIELISIGIVSEEGKEYYAISREFNEFDANEWVIKNVISKLEDNITRKPRSAIRTDILRFVGDSVPIFVANHASYDWVLLCQLFGKMIDLPKTWPTWCFDVRQLEQELGRPKMPEQKDGEHNALADAKHTKACYEFLRDIEKKKKGLKL